MWGWLTKLLGIAGKQVGKKAAEKGAMQVASKIAGGVKTAASMNPQNKSGLSKFLNVLTGDLGKNLDSTGSMVGRAGETPKGTWFNKVKGLIVGDLDEVAKKSKIPPKLKEIVSNAYSAQPIKETPQPSKGFNLGKAAQNLLGGESLGSKMFLNTIGNMGRQGAFSGSDVGQPDKDFWGMLGNSVASSVGQSVGQQRQENFENRQLLLNMAQDMDYSKELMQSYQPQMLKMIEGLKGELVGAMANNRKTGKNYLSSEEIQNFQWKYIDAKKKIDKFNSGIKQLQQAQETVKGKANLGGVYSIQKFNDAIGYFRKYGEPPAEGFLYPNPQSPEEYASTLKVTDVTRWTRGGDGNFVRTSPLTNQQRIELLFADFAAHPRVRAHYEEQGINIDDPEIRYREAAKYAPLVEKPIPDYDAQMRWEEQRADKRQRAADKAESAADKNKPKYKEVADYLGQGKAIVFDNAKTENLDKAYLEGIIGSKIQSDGNVIPITLERIDESGNLHVTYKDRMGTQSTTLPMSKASGLVDTFYPGASEASKSIRPKTEPSKSAMVYNRDMEDKIELFMDKNGIKDRAEAIRILRERKIL
jgi:hypothetical protein